MVSWFPGQVMMGRSRPSEVLRLFVVSLIQVSHFQACSSDPSSYVRSPPMAANKALWVGVCRFVLTMDSSDCIMSPPARNTRGRSSVLGAVLNVCLAFPILIS